MLVFLLFVPLPLACAPRLFDRRMSVARSLYIKQTVWKHTQDSFNIKNCRTRLSTNLRLAKQVLSLLDKIVVWHKNGGHRSQICYCAVQFLFISMCQQKQFMGDVYTNSAVNEQSSSCYQLATTREYIITRGSSYNLYVRFVCNYGCKYGKCID